MGMLMSGACGAALRPILRFKCGSEKRRQLPAIHVFVRRFSGRVVTAGQDHDSVIQMMRRELADHLPRKFRKKSQIIVGVNDQRPLAISRELVEIDHRADGEPQSPQAFEVDGCLDPLANMASGLPVPGHVGKVGGRVIESGGPNAGIVRAGDESVTGTETGADEPELGVALLFEPIEAAADIDHTLSNRIERASDIGRNGVIGAANLGRHADIGIRYAQAQYGNIQQVENLAQRGVGDGIRVPVWKQNDRAAATSRKPARIREIVLRVRRSHRRSETKKVSEGPAHFCFKFRVWNFARTEDLHLAALEPEIGWDAIGIELVAPRDAALVVIRKELLRIRGYLAGGNAVAARPVAGEFDTPLQWAEHANVVDRSEPGFPVVHPFGVARSHVLNLNITGTCEQRSEDAASGEWQHSMGIWSFVTEDARAEPAWKFRRESHREPSPIILLIRPHRR